ncbi:MULTISPECIES: ferredoxin [unclassified Kitasatospora]|uniref:ferredoxin n=1 Tax=unclassified Kitasatospora TaxID=2633591 RepID=UPI0027DC10F7|nr:ferredoxin [Kitasatospora sp. RG8]
MSELPGTRWNITVDTVACIGSSMCVAAAPRHFVMNEADKAVALAGTVGPDQAVLDAAETCPALAITVTDAETGRQLAPEA